MLTRDERRAALFLAAIAALGGVLRVVRTPAAESTGVVAPGIRGGDLERQVALARREAQLLRPLATGETIDVDRASARELERLPGVGPSLARRITQDRDAHGPFGSLEALDQVPGIGPAILATLRPHARFSGPPRQVQEAQAAKAVAPPERGSVMRRTTRRASP